MDSLFTREPHELLTLEARALLLPLSPITAMISQAGVTCSWRPEARLLPGLLRVSWSQSGRGEGGHPFSVVSPEDTQEVWAPCTEDSVGQTPSGCDRHPSATSKVPPGFTASFPGPLHLCFKSTLSDFLHNLEFALESHASNRTVSHLCSR